MRRAVIKTNLAVLAVNVVRKCPGKRRAKVPRHALQCHRSHRFRLHLLTNSKEAPPPCWIFVLVHDFVNYTARAVHRERGEQIQQRHSSHLQPLQPLEKLDAPACLITRGRQPKGVEVCQTLSLAWTQLCDHALESSEVDLLGALVLVERLHLPTMLEQWPNRQRRC